MKSITPNKPLEEIKEDKFNLKKDINRFYDLLINIKEKAPQTLILNGEWGSGKTSFVNFIIQKLKKKNLKYLYFDVWGYKSVKSIQKKLLSQIIESKLGKNSVKDYNLKVNYKKNIRQLKELTIIDIAIIFLFSFPLIFLLINIVDLLTLNEWIKLFFQTFSVIISLIFSNLIWANYIKKDVDFDEFYLENYKKKLDKTEGIFVFIDNLDRLDSKTSMNILEHLKILYSDSSDIFVIVLDEAKMFKDEVDLDKVIDINFEMPSTDVRNNDKYLKETLRKYSLFNINVYVKFIKSSNIKDPRKLKRLLNEFYVKIFKKDLTIVDKYIIFKLLLLKYSWRYIYDLLVKFILDKDETSIKRYFSRRSKYKDLNLLLDENGNKEYKYEINQIKRLFNTSTLIPLNYRLLKKYLDYTETRANLKKINETSKINAEDFTRERHILKVLLEDLVSEEMNISDKNVIMLGYEIKDNKLRVSYIIRNKDGSIQKHFKHPILEKELNLLKEPLKELLKRYPH